AVALCQLRELLRRAIVALLIQSFAAFVIQFGQSVQPLLFAVFAFLLAIAGFLFAVAFLLGAILLLLRAIPSFLRTVVVLLHRREDAAHGTGRARIAHRR